MIKPSKPTRIRRLEVGGIYSAGSMGVRKPLKRRKIARRSAATKKTIKGLPAWLKAIPEGKHGSGTLQKRLWRLTSDFVRIRDWVEFGEFIDTGERIIHWNDAQGGHWRSWPECNGMFKFNEMNIHAQTARGNSWPTSQTWENYRRNLVNRYSEEFVIAIDASNKNWPSKITTALVLKEIDRKLTLLSLLPTQPPYYNRVMKLKNPVP